MSLKLEIHLKGLKCPFNWIRLVFVLNDLKINKFDGINNFYHLFDPEI